MLDIPKIWEGGLAIYGGLIGGVIGGAIVCHFRKLSFLKLLDLCAMSFLIGQGIGRWGNFTNQEAFGTNTNLPWGMWSLQTASYINSFQTEFGARGIQATAGTMAEKAYVHPTFLYESLWCLLSFAVIYLISRKWHKFSGQLFLCYGVLYGAERFVVEGIRLDSLYMGNVRVSQLVSALLALLCLVILVLKLWRMKGKTVAYDPSAGGDLLPATAAGPAESADDAPDITEEAAEEAEAAPAEEAEAAEDGGDADASA